MATHIAPRRPRPRAYVESLRDLDTFDSLRAVPTSAIAAMHAHYREQDLRAKAARRQREAAMR